VRVVVIHGFDSVLGVVVVFVAVHDINIAHPRGMSTP
jgi:hypothetical protein